MSPLVSIIVPVYKVEKYLKRCIDSLLKQTYKNIEIILVDDGSPDNCPQICDEYLNMDSRIVAIHQKNGGLSAARNKGLASSKGDYICFVDSDDYVADNFVEAMLSAAMNESSDLVICNFDYVFEDNSRKKYVFNYEERKYFSEELMALLLSNDMHLPFVVAWSKLYKKELFENLKFKEGIVHEDEEICHKIIHRAKTIYVVHNIGYHYFQRSDSIMGTINPNKAMVCVDILSERKDFLRENDYAASIYQKAILNFCDFCLELALKFKKKKDKRNFKKLIKIVKIEKSKKDFKAIKISGKRKLILKYYLVKTNTLGLIKKIMKWRNNHE